MNSNFENAILTALNEDLVPNGDITSELFVKNNTKSTFTLVVNEDAVLAGLNVFDKTFKLLDKNIKVNLFFKSGDKVSKGDTVVQVYGEALPILKAERTALNFVCHLSGIATLTRELVQLIKHTDAVLLDTRKTTPNLRVFEKEAVVAGGGKNHRFNLGEMVLIKDNHFDVACGISNAIRKARETYNSKYKIEVEVRNQDELDEVLKCRPDIVMFDNWKLNDLKAVLKLVPKGIVTEASGQITIENIKEYAESGVNYISTGYMVKNAKWVDFSLKAERFNTNEI